MTDLWTEASLDHDQIAREAALAQVEAHMEPVWPFLFEARSPNELEHRLAFAGHRLEHIAVQCDVDSGSLHQLARHRFALLQEALLQRQALPEGQDPLAWVPSSPTSGSGAEIPDMHEEGVDYHDSYSEVPVGAPGGPAPNVVTPVFGRPQQPGEATGARRALPKGMCQCGCKLNKKGKCHGCKDAPGNCSCGPDASCGGMDHAGRTSSRRSAAAGDYLAETPPDTGTGSGAVDLGVGDESPSLKEGSRRLAAAGGSSPSMNTLPAGVSGGGGGSPDGMNTGGMLSSTSQSPLATPNSGLQSSSNSAGYDLTPAQEVTGARRDPILAQVTAIAASVRAANPHLPASECRRLARQAVGGYLLRLGDAGAGAVSDTPWADSPGSGSGGGGSGGMSGLEEYGLGKGLMSKLPGGGGGDAAGGLGDLAEVGELAAL